MEPYAGKNDGAGRTGFAKHDGKMNHKMTDTQILRVMTRRTDIYIVSQRP